VNAALVLPSPRLAALIGELRDAVLSSEASARGARGARGRAEAVREQAVSSEDSEDRADIQATLGGDGRAFARLVARHQPAVARHLLRFARDAATREQLVQDTFVEAWGSLAGFRGRAPLQHWLLTLATRVGYRHWTAQARAVRTASLDALSPDELAAFDGGAPAGPAASPADDPREAAELVHRLLARLAPRDRLVITLLHLDGRSVAETAELTGWSRALVKVQAFRARARLRALIDGGGR
jgi:RNA polymerase sigma-70 factor (ECF subfamily)